MCHELLTNDFLDHYYWMLLSDFDSSTLNYSYLCVEMVTWGGEFFNLFVFYHFPPNEYRTYFFFILKIYSYLGGTLLHYRRNGKGEGLG